MKREAHDRTKYESRPLPGCILKLLKVPVHTDQD